MAGIFKGRCADFGGLFELRSGSAATLHLSMIVSALVCATWLDVRSCGLCSTVQADPPANKVARDQATLSQKEIYQLGIKSSALVLVRELGGKLRGNGSGWLFDKQKRLLVTNFHVVPSRRKFEVYFPELKNDRPINEASHYLSNVKPIVATVLYSEAARDLAVLKLDRVPDHIEPARLASESPLPGEQLHSIGNPGSSDALWIYTNGIVRAVYRYKSRFETGQFVDAVMIESQSPINPGDSGGPVFDDRGLLVGVVSSFKDKARLVSHFIDVSEVRKVTTEALELYEPKTANQFFRRGQHRSSRDELPEAILDYSKALKLDPKNASALAFRGACYADLNRPADARTDLAEALKIDPKFLPAYFARIVVSNQAGRFDDVISDAGTILKLSPQNARAHLLRGTAFQSKRLLTSALADFDQAVKLAPNSGLAYFQRGQLHRQAGRFDAAVKDLEQAVDFEPQLTPAYTILGTTLTQGLKDPARAVTVFTNLLRKDSSNGLALGERGRAYFLLDQIQKAEEDLEQAVKLSPTSAQVHQYRGDLHLARRDLALALEDFRRAETLDPSNADNHINIGNVHLQSNNDREALAEFNKAIQLNSRLAQAYVRRAVAHFKLGDNESSQADVKTAKQLDSQFSQIVVKRRFSRFLRITNPRNEPLELQVFYWVKAADGKENWFPAAPPNGKPAAFRIEPKQTTFLKRPDVNANVHAAKVRIWARGLETGANFDDFRTEDLQLAPENGYVSADPETFDFTVRNR